MAPSNSPILPIAANIVGTVFVASGFNALVRPHHALAFLYFEELTATANRKLVDSLIAAYGVRNIFMGIAVYSAAYFGSQKTLGWILLSSSGVAFADGAICREYAGKGGWTHWVYAPAVALIGSLMVGAFDDP